MTGSGIDENVFIKQLNIRIEQWKDSITIDSFMIFGDEIKTACA